jgi:hypothetical protein
MRLSSFFAVKKFSMKGGVWYLDGARSFHSIFAACPANRNLSFDSGREGREQACERWKG